MSDIVPLSPNARVLPPSARLMSEEEVHRAVVGTASTLEHKDSGVQHHGRARAGSITSYVRKTRAKTLDKYVETVNALGMEEDATLSGGTELSGSTPASLTSLPPATTTRRRNTLDDGFRYRLAAKQQVTKIVAENRSRNLRELFYHDLAVDEAMQRLKIGLSSSADARPNSERKGADGKVDEDFVSPLPTTTIPTPSANTTSPPATTASPPATASGWGGMLSLFWNGITGTTNAGGGVAMANTHENRMSHPHATIIRAEQPSAFDLAFELEEKALEDALEQSQVQLRESVKTLKESEKQLEKSRTEQLKRIHAKLIESQDSKIKKAQAKGLQLEKQMSQHAKALEQHIKTGQWFDDTNEEDVVDLREELRSLHLHLDELSVETVFPQCMRWKIRTKVEDGLFVGIRDVDIERLDASFSLKSSGDGKRVEIHVYEAHIVAALYEFVIRGSSTKAKLLCAAFEPTLSRVEIQATGFYVLPLVFDSGGTPTQPAARWVPDRDKVTFQLNIKTTSIGGGPTGFQLPDSVTNWMANSFFPSLLESQLLASLPTRDLGAFLCNSKNELLVRGQFQIHGDMTPRVWRAPLIGPTDASIAARQALGVSEEEAAVLDFLLRSHLANVAGFPKGRAASLAMLHTWRLNYAAHSLHSLAPMMAVLENGVRMKIPPNWTLQLFRRVDELASKPITIQIQLLDVDIDIDVRETIDMISGLYLQSVEASVDKEKEIEAARKARKLNRRASEMLYSPSVKDASEIYDPDDVFRMAKEATIRIRSTFDKTLVPALRDEARMQFFAMLAGGKGGLLAFGLNNLVADICLADKFKFSTVLWQSPEIYEGFVLKVNGAQGPKDAEYTFKLNVLPVGEEEEEDEDDDNDEDYEAGAPVTLKGLGKPDDDCEIVLRNSKLELFPIGRPPGAMHLSVDSMRTSFLLDSLFKGVFWAITPSSLGGGGGALNEHSSDVGDAQHNALKEERRVRRNSQAQTEVTRELLLQSRQVVESMWGSFRILPIVDEQHTAMDVAGIAGLDPLKPLKMSNSSNDSREMPTPTSSSVEEDEHGKKKQLLVPMLTNDAYELHVDIRGLELHLRRVVSPHGSGKPDSIRVTLNKTMKHEKNVECVNFKIRRNLQDVLQADLLPI